MSTIEYYSNLFLMVILLFIIFWLVLYTFLQNTPLSMVISIIFTGIILYLVWSKTKSKWFEYENLR